jgi:endoglucanase
MALAVGTTLLLLGCQDVAQPQSTSAQPSTSSAGEGAAALVIRVPVVAEPGAVPPAVAASDSIVAGTSYSIRDMNGGTTVGTGNLELLTGSARPWQYAGLADLSAITDPGVYQVTVGETVSAPIEVDDHLYRGVLGSTLSVFDANADGDEPSHWHEPSHLHDRRSRIANGPHQGERIDVEGGWMDAGDQLKFTVTTGYATLMLEIAAANQPAQSGSLVDAARIGVRWLGKAHPRRGVFVAQVGHTDADHNAGFRDPTVDDSSSDPRRSHRPSLVLTQRTDGSDVAAITAAALANAALRSTAARRDRLVRRAQDWLAEAERLAGVWHNCCYQQDSWRDDLAVAQAALWRATGRAAYADAALRSLRRATSDGEQNWLVGADSYEMSAVAAAELCGVLRPGDSPAPQDVRRPACRILRAGGEAWAYVVDSSTAFGRAGWAQWGSVRQSESGAVVIALAERAGLETAGPALDRANGWFLGVNPWGVRWQASVGGVEHPYHWVQAVGLDLPGAVVGGPAPLADVNANRGDPLVLGPFDTPKQTYQDLGDDYVMNEVGLGYSAPAALHFALVSPD